VIAAGKGVHDELLAAIKQAKLEEDEQT